jgi:hypothetical protein
MKAALLEFAKAVDITDYESRIPRVLAIVAYLVPKEDSLDLSGVVTVIAA